MALRTDLLIIGAGPFGLALAAYAQHLGIDHLMVGKPMEFWRSNMPSGMFLRSACDWHPDPTDADTIEAFLRVQGLTQADVEPLSLDFYLSYAQWFQRQKMSLREIKDEYRQSEGDPMVKAKIRQLRQQRMRKRMMAEVPKASVIITNPTHYAIALQYDRGMNAPVCLAKGIDLIALKIREVAAAHNIPVVENPPLARALHATVEIDEEIPPEHYKAVAEIIGYVMKLRRSVYGAARN